jgi:xanthine dehydrogenase accessory factor
VVGALEVQAGLLGWETGPVDSGDLAESLAWAGGSAAVVVLSHDPHVDVPALQAALEAGAAYVGAMGSRRTQSRRLERLRAAGVADEVLDRIHRPVGLDLGGRSAPEVALSICAEILAVRHGRDGRSLRDRGGPIHDPAARAGGPAAERP